jgi:hypothetical protein
VEVAVQANNHSVPRLDLRATEQTANGPQAANMISQNEALTKDHANVEGYRQNRGYPPNGQSVTTAGSSFSRPLKEVVNLDQTVAPANATALFKGTHGQVKNSACVPFISKTLGSLLRQ